MDYDFKEKQTNLIQWINNNTILFYSVVNHECLHLIADNELNDIFNNSNITLRDFQNILSKYKIDLAIQQENEKIKQTQMNENKNWIKRQYDVLNKGEYFKFINMNELNNWIILLDEFNCNYQDSDDIKNKTLMDEIEESKLKLHKMSQNIQQLLKKLDNMSKQLLESEKMDQIY